MPKQMVACFLMEDGYYLPYWSVMPSLVRVMRNGKRFYKV